MRIQYIPFFLLLCYVMGQPFGPSSMTQYGKAAYTAPHPVKKPPPSCDKVICISGSVCSMGQCIPLVAKLSSCRKNNDCQSSMICLEGECIHEHVTQDSTPAKQVDKQGLFIITGPPANKASKSSSILGHEDIPI